MRRIIRRGRTLVAPALAMVAVAVGPAPAGAQDVNCSDFATQAAAQDWFEAHGGPAQDPAGLDADHDGVACVIYSG
jgi:excalibur calcium-binding domain-containing protein